MTPNERQAPNSACTCAEGKGCLLHATGMTPDREATLRPYHGSYLGKDEMWAEIDYLRQQLVAKDAEIERLTSTLEGCCESYRDQLASQQAYSERLEAECAAMRESLDDARKELRAVQHIRQRTTGIGRLERNEPEICKPIQSAAAFLDCIANCASNAAERIERELASTTLGTDLLARLQAAEKRRDELVEQNNTLLERFTGAIKALDESSALRSQLAEQERDMRQMVEALQVANSHYVTNAPDGWSKIHIALSLPSAQRMKKGD